MPKRIKEPTAREEMWSGNTRETKGEQESRKRGKDGSEIPPGGFHSLLVSRNLRLPCTSAHVACYSMSSCVCLWKFHDPSCSRALAIQRRIQLN